MSLWNDHGMNVWFCTYDNYIRFSYDTIMLSYGPDRVFKNQENPDVLSPMAKKKRFLGCLRAAPYPSGMLRDRPQTPQIPAL
jgi:hypothetical protein